MCVQVTIYISAYVEAANRDAFMAVKQDLLLAFVDCCNRNGAKLARKRTQVGFSATLLVACSPFWSVTARQDQIHDN